MLQILFLPAEPAFELVEMDEEEAAEREMRGHQTGIMFKNLLGMLGGVCEPPQ